MALPVLAEGQQARERIPIPLTVAGRLAGNDVVQMADGETLDLDAPLPGVFEALDPIRREDQVQIERPVFELDKVLAALDLGRLRGAKWFIS